MVKEKLMTTQEEIIIQLAWADEVEVVRELLEEAARWLTALGIRQWLPGSVSVGFLAKGIERGEVYLARRDGQGWLAQATHFTPTA